MEVYLVSEFRVKPCPVQHLDDLLRRPEALVWVDIPRCDGRTAMVLSETFGFHDIAIRDCLERNHMSKIHVYDDHVFTVLHAPEIGSRGCVHYVELDQFLVFHPGAERSGHPVRGAGDALVIATSVFFISWAAVLGPEFRENDARWVDWATGQAYPLVDAAVCSLVLFQAMRQPAGSRLPWALLGCGMVTLAATDTSYITLAARGDLGDLGPAFSAGWMAAWLLVALAPARQASSTHRVRFLTPLRSSSWWADRCAKTAGSRR